MESDQPAATSAAPAPAPARDRSRLQSLAMIAVFDVAGPLVAYQVLRKAGLSTVSALVLSGVFPAIGVVISVVRRRHVDAIGVLVLAGIAVGTILGLATHNARLVLMESSVPTAVFGLVCLGSLATARPLMYRIALEFVGEDSPRGREMQALWPHAQFRRLFRVMTVVWGVAYLIEAAARVVIVEMTSTGTALAISKVMPYAVAAGLVAWMLAYGQHARRKGERRAAAAAAQGQAPAAAPPAAPSP